MLNKVFFLENRVFYYILWKNIVGPAKQHMTVWHMRIGCWIPKVTNIHSEDVILVAFLLYQWLNERPSVHFQSCCNIVSFLRRSS